MVKIAGVFFLCFSICVFSQNKETETTDAQLKKSSVAVIDDYVISKEDVFDLFMKRYWQEADVVINELIIRYIVREESKSEKIELEREQIQEKAREQFDALKNGISKSEKNISWEDYLKQRKTTEKDLKQELFVEWKYKLIVNHLVKLQQLREKHLRVRHIMLESQEKATEVLNKLKQNADFATLAREESKSAASRDKDGELPLVFTNDLPKEIEEVIWTLKAKDLSPVIKSGSHFHVFEILEAHQGTPETKWKNVKGAIWDSLKKNPVTERDFNRWLLGMVEKHKIKRQF